MKRTQGPSLAPSGGAAVLVLAVLGAAGLISIVTGAVAHWIPVGAGLAVGLLAISRVNRK
jgi:hypothetical protein